MKRLVVVVVTVASLVGGISAAYAAKIAPFSASPSAPAPHHASPAIYPFTCSTGSFFQTLDGQLSSSPNLRSWTKIGTVTAAVNALAYSPATGYLYAIDEAAGANYNDLVQINSHGTVTVLGAVTGLPRSYSWNGGDINSATNTYYVSPGNTTLYAINLSTRVATLVTVPARVKLGYDLIVQQGWIWSVTTSGVSGFSLTTGATKLFTLPRADWGDETGAIWSDVTGDGLYFRWDNNSRTYLAVGLRSTALTVTYIGTTATHQKMNDGATCNAATTPGPDTAPVLGISSTTLTGLGPAKLVRIDLTLTNSYASPVTVFSRNIQITLRDSSSACPAATNFAVVETLKVAATVPGSSTKTLAQLGIPEADWPLITMVDTSANQDACEGTTLTATYSMRYYG